MIGLWTTFTEKREAKRNIERIEFINTFETEMRAIAEILDEEENDLWIRKSFDRDSLSLVGNLYVGKFETRNVSDFTHQVSIDDSRIISEFFAKSRIYQIQKVDNMYLFINSTWIDNKKGFVYTPDGDCTDNGMWNYRNFYPHKITENFYYFLKT